MTGFVLYSNKDSFGKHDASGAFIPEARAFKKVHGISDMNFVGMDCVSRGTTAKQEILWGILEEMGKPDPVDLFAFFGHGWPAGLQCGLSAGVIPRFVDVLKRNCAPGVKVALYACLTAENEVRDDGTGGAGPATDGGFADLLRDEMARQGLTGGWVDGHKTAGHATWNPYVVRFPCNFAGVGGEWLVKPKSTLWRAWASALKSKTGLRHRFPLLSREEIQNELSSPHIPT